MPILKQRGDLGHGEGLGEGVCAAAGAGEVAEEGSGVEGFAEVAGEGADVGAFGAGDADFREGEMERGDVGDVDAAVLFPGAGDFLLAHSAVVGCCRGGVQGRTVRTEVQKFEFVDADA